MNLHSLHIESANLTCTYLLSGNLQNACVVLIHGFCETHLIWQPIVNSLSDNYCIIAPNMPGFGGSELLQNWTMETAAQIIFEILQTHSINKAIIVGHSMGGYIALAFAEKYSNVAKALFLFHSTAFADTDEKKQHRLKVIEHVKKYGTKVFIDEFFNQFCHQNFNKQYPEKINELKTNAHTLGAETIIAALNAMLQRANKVELLKKVIFPIGWLIGKQDPLIPFEKTWQECYVSKQNYVYIIDELGHAAMVEKPELSALILLNFCALCDAGV